MEWAFRINGATAITGPAAELELRAIEGMITADIDVGSSLVELAFDVDRVCGGEILAVLSANGCVPSNPFGARDDYGSTIVAADGLRT